MIARAALGDNRREWGGREDPSRFDVWAISVAVYAFSVANDLWRNKGGIGRIIAMRRRRSAGIGPQFRRKRVFARQRMRKWHEPAWIRCPARLETIGFPSGRGRAVVFFWGGGLVRFEDRRRFRASGLMSRSAEAPVEGPEGRFRRRVGSERLETDAPA